jgi:predicted RNase H-like HicB family nuclease
MRRFTAAVTKEADWYVAQCLEVDVASQGKSVEEALDNLREALALYLEDATETPRPSPIIAPVEVPDAVGP